MRVIPTSVPDVLLLEPKIFGDERGFFFESFNERRFTDLVGKTWSFVQDNNSRSRQGVLRGLHYQLPPHAQGKLVRVTRGEVFDVAVDLRRSSLTFGKWVGEILSAENYRQMWIPPGFAHAFLVMSETADFLYKTTDYYAPDAERCIRWDDPTLSIKWPDVKELSLSPKDKDGQFFENAELFS